MTYRVYKDDIKCALIHSDGYIDIPNQEIYLKEQASNYSEELQTNTLMHEILHAIMRYNDINLEYEVEEHMVTVLATSLIQIIRDNKLDFLDRT